MITSSMDAYDRTTVPAEVKVGGGH
ncbi:hypothetical protein PCAR4_1140009 [Paraburkholderia caribensis]|nr:hypothetical protein PCAR4_1140009 [Paraburkholderia caribensis]